MKKYNSPKIEKIRKLLASYYLITNRMMKILDILEI